MSKVNELTKAEVEAKEVEALEVEALALAKEVEAEALRIETAQNEALAIEQAKAEAEAEALALEAVKTAEALALAEAEAEAYEKLSDIEKFMLLIDSENEAENVKLSEATEALEALENVMISDNVIEALEAYENVHGQKPINVAVLNDWLESVNNENASAKAKAEAVYNGSAKRFEQLNKLTKLSKPITDLTKEAEALALEAVTINFGSWQLQLQKVNSKNAFVNFEPLSVSYKTKPVQNKTAKASTVSTGTGTVIRKRYTVTMKTGETFTSVNEALRFLKVDIKTEAQTMAKAFDILAKAEALVIER